MSENKITECDFFGVKYELVPGTCDVCVAEKDERLCYNLPCEFGTCWRVADKQEKGGDK